jgi:hypothetical protein
MAAWRRAKMAQIWLAASLKVHKNENFFGSDFEFCTFSLLVMLKYQSVEKKFYRATIRGDKIIPLSLRLSRIEFSLV